MRRWADLAKSRFSTLRLRLVHAARLAVGIPDYEAYRDHLLRAHPDTVPMDRETFFRERLEARYGRGRSRCC